MKHLKEGKKFHRKTDQRRALLKGLAVNLIIRGKITTTLSKAKETKKKIERLITIAKKQNLASLKRIKQELPIKAAHKLYYDIAPLYKERKGGYTRIIKTVLRRKRDAAELVILELIKEHEAK
ncbi:MAG: 50S ribosomal protein L17 [Parcubacteria group bacterium]|nr:50S ribosomal protein L17 [Parcubacteria group bacterium]